VIVKLFDIIEHGLGKTVTIDWKHTIAFNPTFGPDLGEGGKGGIKIPAYGNMGDRKSQAPAIRLMRSTLFSKCMTMT